MDQAALRERNRRNVILTGPPRSGTTLACWLLNKVPNTLALVEPIRPFGFVDPHSDAESIRDAMSRFFHRQRRLALEEGIVQSKNVSGKIPSDPYQASRSEEEGLRYQQTAEGTELGDVEVASRSLEPGFWLVVKDPATLSALLPIFMGRFPCYAVVRNPLSILASWDSVNHAARDGHSPRRRALRRESQGRTRRHPRAASAAVSPSGLVVQEDPNAAQGPSDKVRGHHSLARTRPGRCRACGRPS